MDHNPQEITPPPMNPTTILRLTPASPSEDDKDAWTEDDLSYTDDDDQYNGSDVSDDDPHGVHAPDSRLMTTKTMSPTVTWTTLSAPGSPYNHERDA